MISESNFLASAGGRKDMLTNVVMMGSCCTASYAWLSAIAAPLVHASQALVRERASRRALAALGLATGGAVIWTIVPAGLLLLGMILEPRAGLLLIQSTWLVPGLLLGAVAWCVHLAAARAIPRIGATFETATALAIVAAVRDDDRTLARVESLYRAVVTDGSRNVKAAPPSPVLEARTSPPWRTTIARTIDSPNPLPDGTRVPARDASAL
jgi:hypothetical protein